MDSPTKGTEFTELLDDDMHNLILNPVMDWQSDVAEYNQNYISGMITNLITHMRLLVPRLPWHTTERFCRTLFQKILNNNIQYKDGKMLKAEKQKESSRKRKYNKLKEK